MPRGLEFLLATRPGRQSRNSSCSESTTDWHGRSRCYGSPDRNASEWSSCTETIWRAATATTQFFWGSGVSRSRSVLPPSEWLDTRRTIVRQKCCRIDFYLMVTPHSAGTEGDRKKSDRQSVRRPSSRRVGVRVALFPEADRIPHAPDDIVRNATRTNCGKRLSDALPSRCAEGHGLP